MQEGVRPWAPGRAGRAPATARRRVVTVLVALALAGSTGTATALAVPGLTRADAPTPAPVAIVAPVPALGPLAATAPSATATGRRCRARPAGLGTWPRRFHRIGDGPGHRHRAVEPHRRHPTGSRQHREAAHHGRGAADARTRRTGCVTRVVAGPDPGTVILVGGGDPTLTALPAGKEGVYPDPSRLTALADAVRKAAPAPVRRVLVDTSRYSGPTMQPTWDPADIAGGFVTPIEPLMLDGGRKDPAQEDGAARRGPGADRRPGAGRAAGRGCRRASRRAPPRRAPPCSAPSPPRRSRTSSSTRSVRRTTCSPRCSPARSRSSARRSPSFDGAAAQTLVALSQAGFDTAGAQLVDGSGLSTTDRVPAQLLGAVLAQAAAPAQGARDTQFLRPIITGLPVAGGDGTLADRFATGTPSASGRGSCGRRPAR